MDYLAAAKYVGIVGGAILTAWTLFGRFDNAIDTHLAAKFATQQDISALQHKVDTMDGKIDVILQEVHRKK